MDNCCFNRPFDHQGQVRIRLETEAKLRIQERIAAGEIELAWSYILDYENAANPFEERRAAVGLWKRRAVVDVEETPDLLENA
ncbi:MAG TPA: PIN domain protein, partial [Thermoanaerobaculia bacterium]|nr:PIN domain protein [Thermoanaerobaculia bacterium]